MPGASTGKLLASPSCDKEETLNASQSSSDKSINEEDVDDTWKIVDPSELNQQLERSTICSNCQKSKISILETVKVGFAAQWSIICDGCDSNNTFNTTPKAVRIYDINKSLVLALRLIGRGCSAAMKMASVLNLPVPVSRGLNIPKL